MKLIREGIFYVKFNDGMFFDAEKEYEKGKYIIAAGKNCRAWMVNGKLHREDGPAFERFNHTGLSEWWLDDKQYWEEDYKIEMRKRKLVLLGL